MHQDMLVFVKYDVILVLILGCTTAVTAADYRITVKTGRGLLAGTDSLYELAVFDSNNSRRIFELCGKSNRLERGREDLFTFTEDEIPNIDYVTVQRISQTEFLQSWFLRWIKIEVKGAVYEVVVNKWIHDNLVHRFQATLESCLKMRKRIQYCGKSDL